MKRQTIYILAVLLFSAGAFSRVSAHESQPATLELLQVTRDRYEVVWRAPIYYGRPHPAQFTLPDGWQEAVEPSVSMLPDSQVFRHVVIVPGTGIEGSIIRFPGLEKTITDVFVRLKRLDNTTMSAVARPTKPSVQLKGERMWYVTAGEFILLGFHHIMLGVDHLLFVLGLLLIVRGGVMLLKTITAFTVAHSITLGLATLGYAAVPLPPLNAAIALSILFLGPEIVRTWRGETSLTIRYPWVIAFLFGLLHGFGFASGLTTTGMPKVEIPLALLFFNVGVELGQLFFVFTALTLVRSFRVLEVHWPRWAEMVPGYAVGSLGAYWVIQRTVIMFAAM